MLEGSVLSYRRAALGVLNIMNEITGWAQEYVVHFWKEANELGTLTVSL